MASAAGRASSVATSPAARALESPSRARQAGLVLLLAVEIAAVLYVLAERWRTNPT
jgi:hypothetical protein